MELRGRSCGPTYFTVVLHLLSAAVRGEPQLIGSPEPIVGLVGQNVVLPCALRPVRSVYEETVEWTRSHLTPGFVFNFVQGRLVYDMQNPTFRQRALLFQHELRNGNLSLQLNELRLSDRGTFTCRLITSGDVLETHIRLVVGDLSEPVVSLEQSEKTRAVLRCDARNWYPEPTLEWRDEDGRTVGPHNYSTQHASGHYSVYSTIRVEMKANSVYTCSVRQSDIGQTRETNFTFSNVQEEISSLKHSKSTLTVWIIVFGIIIFALVLLVLMYVCGKKFQFLRKFLTTDETDGLNVNRLQAELNNLQEQVANLQEEKETLVKDVRKLKEELEKLKKERQRRRRK